MWDDNRLYMQRSVSSHPLTRPPTTTPWYLCILPVVKIIQLLARMSFEVTSELYTENEFQKTETKDNGNIVAKFFFQRPDDEDKAATVDKDGDLELPRRRKDFILIEQSQSTVLQLVGLQVWRGALLINDYIIHNRDKFRDKNCLELGSGVGLSSILAALYCGQVWCTDLNIGGLLQLIRANVQLNKHLQLRGEIQVHALDFMDRQWSGQLREQVKQTDFIIAADVIYDDTITEAFVATIGLLFEHSKPSMQMLVALEKRFVFTLAELDSVAPCFEHFKRMFDKNLRGKLRIDFIPLEDFQQFFEYDRVKQLVLMKITKIN